MRICFPLPPEQIRKGRDCCLLFKFKKTHSLSPHHCCNLIKAKFLVFQCVVIKSANELKLLCSHRKWFFFFLNKCISLYFFFFFFENYCCHNLWNNCVSLLQHKHIHTLTNIWDWIFSLMVKGVYLLSGPLYTCVIITTAKADYILIQI